MDLVRVEGEVNFSLFGDGRKSPFEEDTISTVSYIIMTVGGTAPMTRNPSKLELRKQKKQSNITRNVQIRWKTLALHVFMRKPNAIFRSTC